jgi:hypothetical protein
MWLEGHLKGSASFFLGKKSICGGTGGLPDRRPAFFHVEKQRFCVFQSADHHVRGIMVEILHTPEEKNLSISLVWDRQYTLELEPKRHTLAYCSIQLFHTELAIHGPQ